MKKIARISLFCVLSYGYNIFGQTVNNSFKPQSHTRFLEITHKKEQEVDPVVEIPNIASVEEYDESIEEYDKTVSVNTKPITLSPLQSFFAKIFGKLLLYYFAARDSIDSYYKQYRNKFMSYTARR